MLKGHDLHQSSFLCKVIFRGFGDVVIAQPLEGHYSTTAKDSQDLIYLLIHLSIWLSHVPKYEHNKYEIQSSLMLFNVSYSNFIKFDYVPND